MIITEEDAIRILILLSHYLSREGVNVIKDPGIEGLGEVKLARRIGEEFPDLKSNVEMALKGDY